MSGGLASNKPVIENEDLHRASVLLVDDIAANLLVLDAILTDEPYNILHAHSGQEALQVLEQNEVAVILLDVQMPGMDGYETARRIRSRYPNAEIPIIFVTAIDADIGYIHEAYSAGGVDFILKPIDAKILVSKIGIFAKLYRQRKQIEGQAEKRVMSELRLKSEALEHSLNGFDIVSHDGRFIYANRAYLKMWGYDSLDEVLGTSPAGHCVDPATPEKIIRSLEENGECEIEFLARRKDGSTFEVRMWARRFYDSEGNAVYPTTSIDITEQKRLEESLRTAVRVRDEFISVASHELRTPLAALQLTMQTLERRIKKGDKNAFAPETVQNAVQTSTKQIKHLTSLIESMLDVSRSAQEGLQYDLKEIDLSEVVNLAIKSCTPLFEARKVQLTIDVRTGVCVTGDTMRLEQALTNLLSNAIKYGAGKPVNVALFTSGATAVLEVKDKGIGIDEIHQERIFGRFERAISPSEVSGLGLGLYIVRQIIEAHGGRVGIETRPGHGSTFRFELPLLSPCPVD